MNVTLELGKAEAADAGETTEHTCLLFSIRPYIRTTAYVRIAGVHTSTMPEASVGYF